MILKIYKFFNVFKWCLICWKNKSQCSKNPFLNAILRKKYNYTLFIYYINNVCK